MLLMRFLIPSFMLFRIHEPTFNIIPNKYNNTDKRITAIKASTGMSIIDQERMMQSNIFKTIMNNCIINTNSKFSLLLYIA